ncbi:hypothetical protein [Neptuniibacter caesariensis]|uniref:Uncharacterized protein n=1 Tax=Neptuniibacter caesariensis TaxID=207954 RepID=A0A7U8C6G4_NEPCE|nr:hypothetical protein [Neptuniibacter caesariensis]EAR61591.1 hypothetical protein MED92_13091 [Oceanospirillum sp. MED92] [Neptuniibacter caesariensis]
MEFKKIAAGSFYYVGKYRVVLAKALAVPFLLLVALDAVTFLGLDTATGYLVDFLSLFVNVIFAIIIHRIVLLGPNSVSAWRLIGWSKRETFFLLHLIGIGIALLPSILLGYVPVLGPLLALIFICWMLGRLSLVFPGIAIDKGVDFKISWELTKNHQLLMFLVVIVLPILIAIPFIAIIVALSLMLEVPQIMYVKSFIVAIVLVFEIAALSMTYQLITSKQYGNS